MKIIKQCLWGCLVLACVAGCAKTAPLRINLEPDVCRPPKSVILFFVDGMDDRRLTRLLADGRLPNIKRRFVDGGVTVEHAITSIPSMTYPNAVALMTGHFPGHHDVVGNQWFDRRTLAFPNYITVAEYSAVNSHFRWPTLFEVLPDHFSVNILGNVARGATYNVDYHVTEGIGWYLGWYNRVDELTAGCIEDVARLANRVKRWPSIIVMYFPGVDQIGHDAGSDSAAYSEGMCHVDAQIGRVWQALEASGLDQSTYAALVTDHSHTPTNGHRSLDLICWLRDNRGLRIHEGRIRGDDYADRLDELRGCDAVLVDGSHRRVVLHLRGTKGWFEPATPEEIAGVIASPKSDKVLWQVPGVGLLCVRDQNRDQKRSDAVRIFSARGEAVVARKKQSSGSLYRLDFCPTKSNAEPDPLDYLKTPEVRSFVEAGWHSSREWLAATADTKYPDFVPQIVEYFDSLRAGDLLIFADEGWAFSGHGRGEHGAALAADMRIPMFFAGPDLNKGGRANCGRIVDVMPTLMDLLGESRRLKDIPLIDGISIAPQLRAQPVSQLP